MRHQLIIGPPGAKSPRPNGPSKLQRLKSGVMAFLALSLGVGVLIAAIVLGSILAVAIILVLLLATAAWFVIRLWRGKM